MTEMARAAVNMTYAVHGDAAVYTPPAGAATPVKVIDNIADSILGAAPGDHPGVVALKPTVNILESTLAGVDPEGGQLVLKGATWSVEASVKINEFERQLILAEETP